MSENDKIFMVEIENSSDIRFGKVVGTGYDGFVRAKNTDGLSVNYLSITTNGSANGSGFESSKQNESWTLSAENSTDKVIDEIQRIKIDQATKTLLVWDLRDLQKERESKDPQDFAIRYDKFIGRLKDLGAVASTTLSLVGKLFQ